MKKKNSGFLIPVLALLTFSFPASAICSDPKIELNHRYEVASREPSDINEHLCILRHLAQECSSVVEIGLRTMVSSWGILLGLLENPSNSRSYLGIDIAPPPSEALRAATLLAKSSGISFMFWQANDMNIDIPPTEMLFIDSLHTYCHLTYELEKFSPSVSKYIAIHDTSEPWGNENDNSYFGNYTEYSHGYDCTKKGLWSAVEDFLQRHPEWVLHQRRLNNHGFTVIKRL